MPPVAAVARGKASRRKGHDAERELAVYLRTWWPDAARRSETGWRKGDWVHADHGDISGCPLVVWQVKHVADLNIAKALADTVEQTIAAGGDYGVLVQRRDGKSDPGRWWAWLTVIDIGRLLYGDMLPPAHGSSAVLVAPLRLEVRHAVALLNVAGYGDPPPPTPVAA